MLTILRKVTTRTASRRPLFYRGVHRAPVLVSHGPVSDIFATARGRVAE